MRNHTTEHGPKTLQAIDREIAEIVSGIFEMRAEVLMQEGALEAIKEEIAAAEREIAAAEDRAWGLLVARACALHPEGEAAEGIDGEVAGKRGGRA